MAPATAFAVVWAFFDKKNGIELEFHETLVEIRSFQVDEADLRMQRLATETAVTLADVF